MKVVIGGFPPGLHASEPERGGEQRRKKEMEPSWKEQDYLSCCGSKRFTKEMAAASPFADLDHALQSAQEIWFNKIDVNGWLEAFASHPAIGAASPSISQWSKEEQSTALATTTDSTMQELVKWNARYREKFGFVFLICASGRGTPEILAELKVYKFVGLTELHYAGSHGMDIMGPVRESESIGDHPNCIRSTDNCFEAI